MIQPRESRKGEIRLPRAFFSRYTPEVAKDLLGKILVRVEGPQRLSGVIVETEAYRGSRDPASHAYRGVTPRNRVMFGEPGFAYIYFSYGSNYCLNVTTEPSGVPGAVLIRAILPVQGLSSMMKNRGLEVPRHVTDGPGKLTRALAIDGELNGEDMVMSRRLYMTEGNQVAKVGRSARIGISRGTSYNWRFFVERGFSTDP